MMSSIWIRGVIFLGCFQRLPQRVEKSQAHS